MDTLKVHSQTITLVDQVEDKLLNYLKEKEYVQEILFLMNWNWQQHWG